MSIEEYKTPSSDLGSNDAGTIIRRPWGIYLVSLWFFLGAGNTFDQPLLKLLQLVFKNEMYALIAGLIITYGFLITVIVGMIKLKTTYLKIAGSTFILIIFVSMFSLVGISRTEVKPGIFISVISVMVVLSSLCAWYCLRPSFLKLADRYVAQKAFGTVG